MDMSLVTRNDYIRENSRTRSQYNGYRKGQARAKIPEYMKSKRCTIIMPDGRRCPEMGHTTKLQGKQSRVLCKIHMELATKRNEKHTAVFQKASLIK